MTDLFERAEVKQPDDKGLLWDKNRTYRDLEMATYKIDNACRDLRHLEKSISEDDDPLDVAKEAYDAGSTIEGALDDINRKLEEVKISYDILEEQVEYWKDRAKDYSNTVSTCLVEDLGYTPVVMEGWKREWVLWVNENIQGKWTLTAEDSLTIFYFEHASDATYFKLSNSIAD